MEPHQGRSLVGGHTGERVYVRKASSGPGMPHMLPQAWPQGRPQGPAQTVLQPLCPQDWAGEEYLAGPLLSHLTGPPTLGRETSSSC